MPVAVGSGAVVGGIIGAVLGGVAGGVVGGLVGGALAPPVSSSLQPKPALLTGSKELLAKKVSPQVKPPYL